jgi:hypothetical protein
VSERYGVVVAGFPDERFTPERVAGLVGQFPEVTTQALPFGEHAGRAEVRGAAYAEDAGLILRLDVSPAAEPHLPSGRFGIGYTVHPDGRIVLLRVYPDPLPAGVVAE